MLRKSVFVIFVSIFILNLKFVYSSPPPIIDATSYILIDQKTGQVLLEKDSDKKVYPASTTKILTAITALENADFKSNPMMTASRKAVNSIGPGGMNIGIMADEKLPFIDLLNAMLIKSANETAYIIGENISGSCENFVDLMNKKAFDIGAQNTFFTNPCGMDTEKKDIQHMTTAADLAKFSRYAMNIPEFREIVSKKYFFVRPTNKHSEGIELTNTNKFLSTESKIFSAVTGIKTGYTDKANYTLVSSAIQNINTTNKDSVELIAVILGVKSINTNLINQYSKQLLEYGFENYSIQEIIPKDQFINSMEVKNSKDNTSAILVTQNNLKCILPNDLSQWNIEKNQVLIPTMAPIKKNANLGYIEYKRNGVILGTVNLIASNDVERKVSIFEYKITKIIILVILVIFAYILLRIIILLIRMLIGRFSRYYKIKQCKKWNV